MIQVRHIRLRMVRLTAAGTALAIAAAGAGTAAARTDSAAPKKITPQGVGGVKLGMTHKRLRARGLVGRLREGCPLAGPGTRSARLRAPLKGSVDYRKSRPRRVKSIAISGGATARGVGIGARRRQVRQAFPRARFDSGTEETFGITLVRIPKDGGGRMNMAIDVQTKKVTLIGVPFIAFCE